VVHEATKTGGWAGEVFAAVCESDALIILMRPLRRLAGKDCPIP
jgi:pyruvate/2-oxoglutarate/acetoin dehydrogenase E1 component